MSEHRTEGSPRVERALEALFAAPAPEPAFVAGLEQQLAARAAALPRPAEAPRARPSWLHWLRSLRRHRWALAGAGLVLILAVALAVVGPRRVLAGIQDLLGYVPGVGFLDLEATRLLPAPVAVRRDGVTLRVDQVVAAQGYTKIVIRSDGLPPEDQLWPGGARQEGDFQPLLRLTDGQRLAAGTWTLRLGGGTLEFPSLPGGVYHATLELARLPLVPAGAAPENWQVPLDLRPATGELVSALFPQPYAPAGAEDTHQDIALRVLGVAHSPEETVVRLQIQWADPDWRFPTVGYFRLPELRDELGHVYHNTIPSSSGSSITTVVVRIPDAGQITPTPVPAVPTHETTQAFAPVSPSAGQLTLWIDAVDFGVPADASFVVDLGADPRVGDRWPLDVDLTVAGFPVHIRGARLVQEELGQRDGTVQRTLLQFDVDPVPDQDGRTLHGIALAGDERRFDGTTGGYDPQGRVIRTALKLADGASLPGGPTEVQVERAGVAFHGPWILTWSTPGASQAEGARPVPVVRRPADVARTRQGLALRVSRAVQTDRLAAVTVELDDPPPGLVLNRVLGWNASTRSNDLYLADDRGRRYGQSDGITWRPGGEPPSAFPGPQISPTLNFEPLDPLARRATLHVPALELYVTEHLAFDVTVPEGIELKPREEPFPPSSEPWAVDVALDAGGYHLRLSQARLEGFNDTTSLALVPEGPGDRPGGPWLTGLRPTAIVAPDGRSLDLAYASRFGQAGTVFDLTDPGTGVVLPGRYHFEVEAVTVAVPGPWDLTWTFLEASSFQEGR
jgi:hypothetical protein